MTDEGALIDDLYGPDYDPAYHANWDIYIWGWVGDPDPTSLLSLFQTKQIKGGLNDCFYSDDRVRRAVPGAARGDTEDARHALIDEMQQLFYDAACYHILYYDSDLHAYADGQVHELDQPATGGRHADLRLRLPRLPGAPGRERGAVTRPVDARGEPGTGVTAGPATPAPSAAPTGGTGSDSTPLLIGAIVVIAVIAGGFWFMRRRGPAVEEE